MNYSLFNLKMMNKVNLLFTLFLLMLAPVCLCAQPYTISDKWVDCGNDCQIQDPYYSEGESIVWDGGSKNGKAHGKGTAIRYANGEAVSTYEGEYKNGVRQPISSFTRFP